MITHLIKTSYFVLKLLCSRKSLLVQLLTYIGGLQDIYARFKHPPPSLPHRD